MATAVTPGGRGRVPAFRLRRCLEQLAAAVAAGAVQPERGELLVLTVMCRRAGVEFPPELARVLDRMAG